MWLEIRIIREMNVLQPHIARCTLLGQLDHGPKYTLYIDDPDSTDV